MSEKQPYDPKMDKVLFQEDYPEEKMRVTAYSYNGASPKFKFTPIYTDRDGKIRVETVLSRSGQYNEKPMYRLNVIQINKIHRVIQQKLQEGIL
jgi:hypothetical protein